MHMCMLDLQLYNARLYQPHSHRESSVTVTNTRYSSSYFSHRDEEEELKCADEEKEMMIARKIMEIYTEFVDERAPSLVRLPSKRSCTHGVLLVFWKVHAISKKIALRHFQNQT